MTKCFISGTAGFGGSQLITTLPDAVKSVIDEIVKAGDMILIGDCKGIDTLVQSYLKSKNYDNVMVYCSGNTCRNCLDENWCIKHVAAYGTGRAFYAMKDKAMVLDSDYGLAIWDGKSHGTGENIKNMHSINKPCHVYRTDLRKFEL